MAWVHVTCVDVGEAHHIPETEPEPRESETEPEQAQEPAPEAPQAPKKARPEQLAILALADALRGKVQNGRPHLDEAAIRTIVQGVLKERDEAAVRTVIVRAYEKPDIKIDLAHEKFPALLYHISQGMHVYAYGPHGSGKSHGGLQAGTLLGKMTGYISLTPQTPESRLLGYMDAHGKYISTRFREVYEAGGVFVVDELDNAAPSLLTTLNGALENGHAAFPDAVVKMGEGFTLIGTGNTSGRGANPSYPERRPFDAAFADRFCYLAWDYDEALERQIALSLCPAAGPWVEWVQAIRAWTRDNLPRMVPSPRVSIKIARYLAHGEIDRETALDAAFFRGVDPDSREKVLRVKGLPAWTAPRGK